MFYRRRQRLARNIEVEVQGSVIEDSPSVEIQDFFQEEDLPGTALQWEVKDPETGELLAQERFFYSTKEGLVKDPIYHRSSEIEEIQESLMDFLLEETQNYKDFLEDKSS